MKTYKLSTFLLIAVLSFVIGNSISNAQHSTQPIKIGIYDSRAIAVAYANSEMFKSYMANLMAEYKKAKEEKASDREKELEKEGPFLQQLLHQQSFSNGTVSNIIDKIKDKLPAIAQSTGVSLIISKWELAYINEEVETVDLTNELVSLFNPTDQALKWIEGVRKQNPIPIDKLNPDHHK